MVFPVPARPLMTVAWQDLRFSRSVSSNPSRQTSGISDGIVTLLVIIFILLFQLLHIVAHPKYGPLRFVRGPSSRWNQAFGERGKYFPTEKFIIMRGLEEFLSAEFFLPLKDRSSALRKISLAIRKAGS
jgi:hypothetical protein